MNPNAPHCRIARFTLKSNGRTVEVFNRIGEKVVSERASILRGDLHRHVSMLLDNMGNDLDGFAIVAWTHDGRWSRGYRANLRNVSKTMLPSFVAEVLRQDLTTEIVHGVLTGDDNG